MLCCYSACVSCSVGKSVLGQQLWVLEISDKPGQVEAKPNFLYIANMHGDEPSGRWERAPYKKGQRVKEQLDSNRGRIVLSFDTVAWCDMSVSAWKLSAQRHQQRIVLASVLHTSSCHVHFYYTFHGRPRKMLVPCCTVVCAVVCCGVLLLFRVLLAQLAEQLCAGYKAQEPLALRVVREMHLHLMPTMNPDGFAQKQRSNA